MSEEHHHIKHINLKALAEMTGLNYDWLVELYDADLCTGECLDEPEN